jgi:hypothetical protein
MWTLSRSGENSPPRPLCLADEAVLGEPVSSHFPLLTGKIQGISAKIDGQDERSAVKSARNQSLARKFPEDSNREFLRVNRVVLARNRETAGGEQRERLNKKRRRPAGDFLGQTF